MARESIIKEIPNMSKEKATKCLIYGLIIAVIFGLIMTTSMSLGGWATNWKNMADYQNQMGYWDGLYSYGEYIQNGVAIQNINNILVFQPIIVVNIARFGISLGLIFMVIGFISFAVNDSIDEKARHISLILGGLVLLLFVFSLFFTNVGVTINYW